MIDALVVGLGNPGKEYARTRHNVGAEAVALLVERAGEKFKAGRNKALVADARIAGKRVILAFPTTYMNESGQAVGALMRRHKIADPQQLIVVHDELDLPPGTVRVKVGGGLAGNNGLRMTTRVSASALASLPRKSAARTTCCRACRRLNAIYSTWPSSSPPMPSRCCWPKARTRPCKGSTDSDPTRR